MKIQCVSDLHLEFFLPAQGARPAWHLPRTAADVIVLAGDIWLQGNTLAWVRDEAAYQVKPVIFVFGNHDYWATRDKKYSPSELDGLARDCCAWWRDEGVPVYFLENDTVTIGDTRFLGCTLWTAYLDGDERAMQVAENYMVDFARIPSKNGNRRTARDFLAKHRASVRFLERSLAREFDGKTVVVTHHAPHALGSHAGLPQAHLRSSAERLMDHAFYTDLTWLMDAYAPDLWIFGHTHLPCDFRAGKHRVRLVSNPRGYDLNGGSDLPGYDAALTIEV